MKKKISLLLSLAVATFCLFPQVAFAANETTGSTDIVLEFPQPSTGDDGPSYSYKVNIPANFTLTNGNTSFQITASEMTIPEDKELVVRINGAETFENDGSFYLFLNGDKASENWVLCNIFRLKGAISSAALGTNPVIASFRPGELSPHDWDSIRFEAAVPYGDASFQPGTYTGTVYYTIGLD